MAKYDNPTTGIDLLKNALREMKDIPTPKLLHWLEEVNPPEESREPGERYPEWHYFGRFSDFEVHIAKSADSNIWLMVNHFYLGHLDWNKHMTVKVPHYEQASLHSAEETFVDFLTAYEEARNEHYAHDNSLFKVAIEEINGD